VDPLPDRHFPESNLGGGEITELMEGGMGFRQPKDKPAAGLDRKGSNARPWKQPAASFSPEFMNRLDKIVVFHPLRREQLEKVLENRAGPGAAARSGTAKGQFSVARDRCRPDFLCRKARTSAMARATSNAL